jgi:crotonobetaine/carnitine-CoA ligase
MLLTRNSLHPFSGMDVPALLEMRAATRREYAFIVWAPFDGPTQRFSYGEFLARVQRVAGGLKRRGVQRGQRVLIHLDNCPEALLAWYACTWIGAVAVTTNARAASEELAYYAEHSEAVGGITQPRFAALVAASCPGLGWLAVTDTDNGVEAAHAPDHDSSFANLDGEAPARIAPVALAPCSVQFTAGPTSRP